MQRSAIDAVRKVGVGALRLVERAVGGERDEGAEIAVVSRDAIETRPHEIDRRRATCVDQRRGGLQWQQRDVAHGAEWYERRGRIVLRMDDRSFMRFGGLAAILLALTSWAAVLAYGVLVQPDDPEAARIGLQVFQFLYALIALWALFAIVAVYYRVRAV